jgi:hypothetical protein
MRAVFNRALIVAAGVVASIATASPSLALESSDAAKVNLVTAPASRLADYTFRLDLPGALPGLSSGPPDLSRYATNEVDSEFVLFDGLSLTTGINADVARLLDRSTPAATAYDGLFLSASASTSPYLSLSSGGTYVGLSAALADGLHFSFGRASRAPGLNPYLLTPTLAMAGLSGQSAPYDARSTSSLLASLSWDFAKWGGVNLTAAQTTEQGGALGDNYAAVNAARTQALGVSAHVGFGGGWVTTASYSEGATQLDLRPGALVADTLSEMHMESYGIAVAKHGLFGNDALGVAFSHPAPSYGASGFSAGDMQFFGRDKLFAGTSPETDIELGYVTNFFGNSVALQANAAYQTNVGGLNGNNAVSLLSRAKIKF